MSFILVDEKGRRYFVPESEGKVRVRALGVVDAGAASAASPGSAISIAGKRFLILAPTVSDLMNTLERGPQVIMEKDASLIAHFLDIRCGHTVLEIGAGSGSLSLKLLSTVGEKGMVVTVDNRPEHLRVASTNVSRSGIGGAWHPILADGRKFTGASFADAASIDIPDPWNALESAWHALRPGRMLSSYSPTVNQTERTVSQAASSGFRHETSFEVMMRKLEVTEGATRHSFDGPGHTGYISIFRKVG